MGTTQDFSDQEAIVKLQELAKDQICLLGTYPNAFGLDARPMATQAVRDDGTFLFFSRKDSTKNGQIAQESRVELLYANSGSDSYLVVKGSATVFHDQALIDELWSPFAKTWFPEGKDDPNLTLIRVVPEDAHYWDTRHGKMVQLLKILWSAATGDTKDDGVEGDLSVG